MSEAARLLGAGDRPAFTFKGKPHPVGERTVDVEAMVGAFVADRTYERHVRRFGGRVPEAEYQGLQRAHLLNAAAEEYEWGSEACVKALSAVGSPAWRELAYLQLKLGDPSVRRDLVDEVCADREPVKGADGRPLKDEKGRVIVPAGMLDRLLWGAPGPFGPSPPTDSPS